MSSQVGKYFMSSQHSLPLYNWHLLTWGALFSGGWHEVLTVWQGSTKLTRAYGLLSFTGFQWTIFTFGVVSILCTVSLIFQMSPWVARGVCDFRRRLKFKLIYSPSWPPGQEWQSPLSPRFGYPLWCFNFFFLHSVRWNAVPSLYF